MNRAMASLRPGIRVSAAPLLPSPLEGCTLAPVRAAAGHLAGEDSAEQAGQLQKEAHAAHHLPLIGGQNQPATAAADSLHAHKCFSITADRAETKPYSSRSNALFHSIIKTRSFHGELTMTIFKKCDHVEHKPEANSRC
jgi:hypothetical protein